MLYHFVPMALPAIARKLPRLLSQCRVRWCQKLCATWCLTSIKIRQAKQPEPRLRHLEDRSSVDVGIVDQCWESKMIYSRSGFNFLRVPDPGKSSGSNRIWIRPQLFCLLGIFKKIPHNQWKIRINKLKMEHSTVFSELLKQKRVNCWLFTCFF